ncbi:MAG: hypothetical protein ACI9TH_003519 [Kiritimatiellia bacterium]
MRKCLRQLLQSFEHQGSGQADFDGDGVGNGDEGVAGTDFTDGAAYFKITSITRPTPAVITFPSATGRVYAVEYTENMVGARRPGRRLPTTFRAPVVRSRLLMHLAVTNRCFRVRVEVAPTP